MTASQVIDKMEKLIAASGIEAWSETESEGACAQQEPAHINTNPGAADQSCSYIMVQNDAGIKPSTSAPMTP